MSTARNPPSTHKDYTDYIIGSVQAINPHSNQEGRVGYVYAAGFLASYLASLMQEDPWAYKRFQQHIEGLKDDRKN
jgi:hypothetical protein